jgi:outer membrane PBP1 activator LpoA protein
MTCARLGFLNTCVHSALKVGEICRHATCFLLSAILFACAAPTSSLDKDARMEGARGMTEDDAMLLINDGRVLAAIQIFTMLAANTKDPAQKQDIELKLVEILLDAGYAELALDELREVTRPSLTPVLAQRRRIAEARAAIALGDAERALELLPGKTHNLSVKLQIRAGEVAAQAHAKLGDIEKAVLAYAALEELLTEDWAIEQNHLQIWRLLDTLPDIQLASLVSFGRGSIYQGWIELAQTVHTTHQQSDDLASTLPAWLQQFPNHPAATFALSLVEQSEIILRSGEQVALLLPLSGKLGEVAAAVRDGFFAAYYADSGNQRPDIRVYDISDTDRDIFQHYSLAVVNGADVIVGPLDKTAISKLANLQDLPIPTIGLNYTLDNNVPAPRNLFQFGLLPEDEARAVAEFAASQGHKRAIAMVPDGEWGTRLIEAFTLRFVELGGSLLDYQAFQSNTHDFSRPIKRLLNLEHSEARKKILRSILSVSLEFEPARRQDVDFIFLAAPAKLARQIKPQFKYHRGSDIPIYATSRAFSGTRDAHKDADMDGLLVSDIPWLLSDAADGSRLYRQVNAHWPQQGSLTRLYALGIDAYDLLPHIFEMADNPDIVYPGRTGDLSIVANNRIQRRLQWAEFIDGVPVKLPEIPQLEDAVGALASGG